MGRAQKSAPHEGWARADFVVAAPAARAPRTLLARAKGGQEPPPPAPEGAPRDHLTLHLPVLAAVATRLEAIAHGPQGPEHKAVLELPVPKEAHHFFANPVSAVEATCRQLVDKMVFEAGRAATHFACRWAGLLGFAALGIWAGHGLLRGRPALVGQSGHPHPVVGWGLLALSLPVPVLPLLGVAVGEQVARVITRGLAPRPSAGRPAGG